MLDAAQKEIGLAQVLLRPGADPVVDAELAQHVERARAAHLRTAAAEDQLLCLDEEFDLADAAAAELHVVAGHDDAVVAADRINLALHCVDVGDGGVVEVLSPDERREVGEEALAEVEIARRGPRLDQRGALPVLTQCLVIGVGADRRQRHRGRGGVGPQAQVDPQHVAVAGALLQDARERLGDAHIKGAGLRSRRNSGRRRVVKHDEVDIARIVELARALLAERQHNHAAAGLRLGSFGIEREPSGERVLAQEKGKRSAERRIGEAGQRLGRGDDVPYAADIGKRDEERGLALGETQQAHELALVVVAAGGERRDERIERLAGRPAKQANETRRVFRDERPEVGRMIRHAEEQIADPLAGNRGGEPGGLRRLGE